MQEWCKIDPKWIQIGSQIDQTSIKNEFSDIPGGPRRNSFIPLDLTKHIQINKITNRKTKKTTKKRQPTEDNLQNIILDDVQG